MHTERRQLLALEDLLEVIAVVDETAFMTEHPLLPVARPAENLVGVGLDLAGQVEEEATEDFGSVVDELREARITLELVVCTGRRRAYDQEPVLDRVARLTNQGKLAVRLADLTDAVPEESDQRGGVEGADLVAHRVDRLASPFD